MVILLDIKRRNKFFTIFKRSSRGGKCFFNLIATNRDREKERKRERERDMKTSIFSQRFTKRLIRRDFYDRPKLADEIY